MKQPIENKNSPLFRYAKYGIPSDDIRTVGTSTIPIAPSSRTNKLEVASAIRGSFRENWAVDRNIDTYSRNTKIKLLSHLLLLRRKREPAGSWICLESNGHVSNIIVQIKIPKVHHTWNTRDFVDEVDRWLDDCFRHFLQQKIRLRYRHIEESAGWVRKLQSAQMLRGYPQNGICITHNCLSTNTSGPVQRRSKSPSARYTRKTVPSLWALIKKFNKGPAGMRWWSRAMAWTTGSRVPSPEVTNISIYSTNI